MAVIVTMLNQKGGVGKTSTTHHLAGTLAKMGRRILLLDNDPQSSLSQGFFGPSYTRGIDPAATIAGVYSGEAWPEQVIRPTGVERIDLVAGSRHATRYNTPLPHEAGPEAQAAIRSFLDEAAAPYDWVLIDCPPNLHLCSWAALAASDFLIVPLQPEDYGAQGIVDVQESVESVRALANPGLALLGFLLTMVAPRRAIHQLYEERLRGLYGDDVFASRVPESVDYVEAIARRLPISSYKPKGVAAKAIGALAEEVEARAAARSARTEAA